MKLVTILLNWRTPQMTLDALRHALRALEHVEGGWRVLVVDNDSQDGSEEILRDAIGEATRAGEPGYDRVEVLQSGHNGGFGAGNNVGIRHASSSEDPPEYIYILNSDAFPAEDAIRRLVQHLDSNADVGIVGSYIHGTDGEPHVTAFRFPSIRSEIEGSLRLGLVTKLLRDHTVPLGIPDETVAVDWLAGASMMMRSSMLRDIGLFDETFFLYFEETDLCRRAALAGWKTVYVRESHVAHIGSVSTGMKTWNRIPTYWLDSRRHYFEKNHGRAYQRLATALLASGTLLWEVRRRVQRKPDANPPSFLADLVRHAIRE